MEKQARNFLSIFELFWVGTLAYGDVPTPFYNEDCPVPDVSERCLANCTDNLTNCIADCGNDEVQG